MPCDSSIVAPWLCALMPESLMGMRSVLHHHHQQQQQEPSHGPLPSHRNMALSVLSGLMVLAGLHGSYCHGRLRKCGTSLEPGRVPTRHRMPFLQHQSELYAQNPGPSQRHELRPSLELPNMPTNHHGPQASKGRASHHWQPQMPVLAEGSGLGSGGKLGTEVKEELGNGQGAGAGAGAAAGPWEERDVENPRES